MSDRLPAAGDGARLAVVPLVPALPREGPRVVVRRVAVTDLARFQAYRNDPDVGLYQGWEPQPDEEARAFLDEMSKSDLFQPAAWIQLAIADRASGALIGDIGVCVSADASEAEIGFTLAPEAQGRGLATEAVREVIALVFERTPVSRVVGITDQRNEPSIRTLERLGMRRVRSAGAVFRGEPCVEHTYELRRPSGR